MDLKLDGKVAAVTGGARGIGRAIAQTLASEGAAVAVLDRATDGGLEETVRGICQAGGQATAIHTDVSSFAALQDAVEQAVSRFGQLDLLVNNAGIVSRKSLVEVPLEEWDLVLRTNLNGCFYAIRAFAQHVMARNASGRVVNISSVHGNLAKANMGSYCTSKAAIDMLTRQFAVELAPHGIAVNAVAPGTISTDINLPLYRSVAPTDIALRTATLKRVPLGRLGEPLDIANTVAFLCSDAAGYITGAVYYVDGGYTAEGTPRT